MPKTNIDYSKTIIYKISCIDDNITEIYVGSTTDYTRRKSQHKSACNNEKDKKYNQKLYKMIRDNGGWLNWRMIEVEKFPCNDKREAECREEYWRTILKAELNGQRCWRNIICIEPNCKSSAQSPTDYCIKHGGGKRCIETDCKTGAIGTTEYCSKHGGGRRCIETDCENSARISTEFCVKHGGGKRCIEPGCKTSAQGSTDYCKKHGGGKRCIKTDCKSSAVIPTDYCVKHGGGKRCKEQDCKNSALSHSDYCAKHGEQYTCGCGSTLSIKSKNRHNKTKKHQKYLSTL